MPKRRRCRQNRGSFRRSFASRVGRGLAARRQAGGRRAPAERAIVPSGNAASMRLVRRRRIPADRARRGYGDRGSAPRESFARRAPPTCRLLERVSSSDMLRRAYNAEISRGFEFSAMCIRRLDPRTEVDFDRIENRSGHGPAKLVREVLHRLDEFERSLGRRLRRLDWEQRLARVAPSGRFTRRIPAVDPSHRSRKTGEQSDLPRYGVSSRSDLEGPQSHGMGFALAKNHWVASLIEPAPLAGRGTRNEETVG